MVKNVKRKLKSRTGASILISLMFFLVVMMVGAVCLVAAYNNSGRATRAKTDAQHSYAVQSAIKLIQGDLAKDQAKFIFYPEYDGDNIVGYKVEKPVGNREDKTDPDSAPLYGKLVYDLMQTTFVNGDRIYRPTGLQMRPKPLAVTPPEGYESLKVVGTIKIGSTEYGTAGTDIENLNFDVEVSVWVEEKGNKTYATTITIPAAVRYIDVFHPEDETVTRRVEVTWTDPRLGRMEAVGS